MNPSGGGFGHAERPRTAPSAGDVLDHIRSGRATTRGDLVAMTGLGRATVAQHLDALMARRLVSEDGHRSSTGGRPAGRLVFNHEAGVVLSADLGATHTSVGVTDLAGTPLAQLTADLDIASGPEAALDWVLARFDEVLAEAGRDAGEVRGVGIGVPGPVEHVTGRPVNPPIMPGWDGFPIPERVAAAYDVPVLVDNDVNIMAIGEYVRHYRYRVEHLVYIKVGTGIGSGIVANGSIHRGADGAAGDIGHIQLSGHQDAVCRCGNRGCLEAVAGGGAMAATLARLGHETANSRDVVRLARAGEADAVQLVRDAGRLLGEVLAAVVSFFNPRVIVVGGDVAHAGDSLLAGVREGVYTRSLPLATRDLRIARALLDDAAGVIGAATMVIEHVMSPDVVDRAVSPRAAGA